MPASHGQTTNSTDMENMATATTGIDRRYFSVAARKLEGKYRGFRCWAYSLASIFEDRATFSLNLPTVEQDTDTEDMATATAGTDRRSLAVAVRKLEGKRSTLA